MGVSRRLRQRCAAVLAIFVAAMGVAFGFSAPVGAADEASGSAFALFAQGLVDIDPEPEAAFPPGGQDTTIEIDLGGLLLACTLNASSRGFDGDGNEVDNVADAESVESSASVETATLLGNPDADCEGGDEGAGSGDLFDFLDDLVDILDGTGIALTAISSQCTADADGVSGSSTLVGLDGGGDIIDDLLGDGLDLDQLALDLGLDLGADLGILELELDEQIEDADGNGITVRALRLTLLPGDGGDEPLQEVILAESQCRFLGDDDGPGPDPDPGDDNDARNDSDVSNESDGTAVIETGDANAVGNIADTEINQSAGASGGFSSVDQDATVINEGVADANTGANTAIGNNSLNVAENRQSAVAANLSTTTTGTIPGANTATNHSRATNTSSGTAAISTGDANAAGNIAETEINQSAGASGGFSSVDQDATVVNIGDAGANTGANTAIGNNSTNVAVNDQAAAAVGAGGTDDDCCDEPEGSNTASNTSSATNDSGGTAAIVTGDADAVGNVSGTEITQTGTATGGAGAGEPCGGTCDPDCDQCPEECPDPEPECPRDCDPEPDCPDDCDPTPCEPTACNGSCHDDGPCGCSWSSPWGGGFHRFSSADQSATVENSGSANANTGGNTAIGNNSTNVVSNDQTAVAAGG